MLKVNILAFSFEVKVLKKAREGKCEIHVTLRGGRLLSLSNGRENAEGFIVLPASEKQIRYFCRSIGREGLPYLLFAILGNNEKRESFPAKGNSPHSKLDPVIRTV